MDLTTVLTNLSRGSYASPSAFASDVRLIWKNCMSYNADGSDFYLLAQEFSKRFEEKFSKVASAAAAPATAQGAGQGGKAGKAPVNDTMPSATEKSAFARSLFRIGKEELGKVVTVLDDKSPACLTKNSAEDEVEIDVDQISARVFWEVYEYVENVVGAAQQGGQGGKKK